MTDERPTASIEERAAKGQETLEEILRLMPLEAQVEMSLSEEYITLDIQSESGGVVIGKKGQTLDALQFIVARIVGAASPGRGRIIVDAEGYRERRANQLRSMAHQVAERVREEKVAYAFDPTLNGAERRIVHMELKAEPDPATQSEGEGDKRRLVVFPESES